MQIFQLLLLGMSISLFVLPYAKNFSHLTIFSVIYGVFDGAFTGFVLPVIATIVPRQQVGIAVGTLYSLISLELMFGAPLAGQLIHISNSLYLDYILSGISLAVLVLYQKL